MKPLDIEGRPRDATEDAKLHPDLAHPNPPRNVVKSCAKTDGCLHLHGHYGRCRTAAECVCDLRGPFCEVHQARPVANPRSAPASDLALPDHLLKEF